MRGALSERYATALVEHSRLVVVAMLVLTVAVAAGAAVGEGGDAGIGEFEIDSPETEAAAFVEKHYPTDDRVIAQVVVRDRDGDVLTRESLLEGLRLQQAAREDDSIDATLTEDGFVGFENVVATAAVAEDAREAGEAPPTEPPALDEQIEALEDRDDEEVEELVTAVLDGDRPGPGGEDPAAFLPTDREPGSTEAEARLTFVFQIDDGGPDEEPRAAYDAQLAIADMVDERFDDAFVFGQGISDDASSRATGDSFAIITPVALAFVLVVLGVTYRDPLDVLIALFGIAVVLAWLAGTMGWLEIPMTVLLIAVPFLLIGLSIDYALHVVMRYREARAGTLDGRDGPPDGTSQRLGVDRGVRAGMVLGLGSVVLALAAATVSTGVGFLSNVVSPLPAIRDFAVLSAAGILATFLAFGVLVPALKVEVDGFVEGRLGRSRAKPAFGVGGGVVNRTLEGVAGLASRAPVIVVAIALVFATAGAVGATTIDTEFNEADFLPEDAPTWAKHLPGPLAPDTYTIADDFAYLGETFELRGQGGQSEILIRGDVADGDVLRSIDDATASVEDGSSVQTRTDGTAAVDGPHTLLREVAAENETVAAAIDDADETGNGLPDRDVEAVYALAFDADEETAAEVLSRNDDGEITSARLVVSVRADESAQTIADDTRALAATTEDGAPAITAVTTGATVTTAVIQDALLETLVQAFAVTLVVILAFLCVLFWVRHRAPTQGVLVVAPVVMALAWLLGAMALLEIPFNSETAVITSLAIGLGVDYSIHAGERFVDERERRDDLEKALQATITGTGGALLASALTTAGGFGVLALALSPPLQRFGLVTGTAIGFAFVAVITVLPCLLVVRERLQSRWEQ